MDTELLVDSQIEDGQQLLAELARDRFDVEVALWVRTVDEGLWFLYIGSPSVGTRDLGNSYRRVYACLSRIPNPSISLSQVKLVHSSNSIATEAIAIRDRHPGRLPTRYGGKRIGNLVIEEAYTYPGGIGPMTRNEVMQTVVGLMNRTGILQPSIVTFRNGTSVLAVPIGIDMKSPGSVYVTLHEDASGQNRIVAADEIADIK